MHDAGAVLIIIALLGIVWQVLKMFHGMVVGHTPNRSENVRFVTTHTLLICKKRVERFEEIRDFGGHKDRVYVEQVFEEANPNLIEVDSAAPARGRQRTKLG
jgi:hypothetical protein